MIKKRRLRVCLSKKCLSTKKNGDLENVNAGLVAISKFLYVYRCFSRRKERRPSSKDRFANFASTSLSFSETEATHISPSLSQILQRYPRIHVSTTPIRILSVYYNYCTVYITFSIY